MNKHLNELVAEINESPKKNTYLDAQTDEQAIQAWEAGILQSKEN